MQTRSQFLLDGEVRGDEGRCRKAPAIHYLSDNNGAPQLSAQFQPYLGAGRELLRRMHIVPSIGCGSEFTAIVLESARKSGVWWT